MLKAYELESYPVGTAEVNILWYLVEVSDNSGNTTSGSVPKDPKISM
jgi:hypothetical protein